MPASPTARTERPLPPLRPDLVFYPGPYDPDGSPTFTIFDPASGQYHKIGWGEALVLQRLRPGMTLPGLLALLARETTIRPSAEDVLQLCEQATRSNLLALPGGVPSSRLMAQAKARKVTVTQWLLQHYLYLRIPILYPDSFLKRTLPFVRLLASPVALAVYALAAVFGVSLVAGRVEEYFSTFTYFFTPLGALSFGVALTCVKVVHEFAHSYVASGLGVRVRSMGAALIVFWPVPFSDVTDSWKLKRRRDRFLIGFAGIASELVLAGLSLLVWSLTPEGIVKSIAFLISSTTVVSTLIVNLNPAMRYDGYYLLSDAWGIDNLRQRSSDMSRWWLRKFLFGFDLEPPEERVHCRRLAGMLVFSVYSWIYRVGLYISIAVLVYYKFTKAIGIVLFVVEIWAFMVKPLLQEAKMLYGMRERFTLNRRSGLTLGVLGAVFLWALLPFPRRFELPAIALPVQRQIVYAPTSGVVRDIHAERLASVSTGDPLLRIDRPSLATEVRVLEIEREILQIEVAALGEEEEDLSLYQQRVEELGKVDAELAGLRETVTRNQLTSLVDGTVSVWDDTLCEGQPITVNRILGEIASTRRLRVVAFAAEEYVDDVQAGDSVDFLLHGRAETVNAAVVSVSPVTADPMDYWSLTSLAGGELPVVREEDGRLAFLEGLYQVEVELAVSPNWLKPGRSGIVRGRTRWRSLLLDLARRVWSKLVGESGF